MKRGKKRGAGSEHTRRPRSRVARKSGNLAGVPASAPDPKYAGLTFYDPSALHGVNAVTGRPWSPEQPMYPFVCAECRATVTDSLEREHLAACSMALPF